MTKENVMMTFSFLLIVNLQAQNRKPVSLRGKSINNFKSRSWNSSLAKQYTLIIEQTWGTKVLVLAIIGMVSDLSCVGRSGLHGNEKVSLGSKKNCGTLLPLKTDKLKSNVASVFSINEGGSSSEPVPYLKSCHGNLLKKDVS